MDLVLFNYMSFCFTFLFMVGIINRYLKYGLIPILRNHHCFGVISVHGFRGLTLPSTLRPHQLVSEILNIVMFFMYYTLEAVKV